MPLIPAPEQNLQLAGPMEELHTGGASLRWRRFLLFLPKFWWIPAATLAIGIVLAGIYIFSKAPAFVSRASMWETLKLRLPEGGVFSDDAQNNYMQNYAATLSGFLNSKTLEQAAIAILKSSTNSASVKLGKDGEPLPVAISVAGSAKSEMYVIQAVGTDPWFTQTYLDAVMQAYLDYMKTVRAQVSGETLASLSDQMQKWERDLKAGQDALLAFQRTNNLAILQEEATVAGSYLTKLKTQLSDLQLEASLLDAATNNPDLVASGAVTGTSGAGSAAATGASAQQQSSRNEVAMLKLQREKLSKYLRPKHPKIVKLDADIEHAEQMEAIYQRQDREQLAATRQANQLKTENVLASIKEWEGKVVAANATIAEAERLKLDVQRTQSVYDRLQLMVQNVGISRNIDQESLAVLEPATPTIRSYSKEKNSLVLAVLGGLAAGLGIVFLIAIRDDRFTSVTEVSSTLSDPVVGLLPEVSRQEESVIPLLKLNDPRHVYAESYRSLRSALLFQSTDGERPKVLLITSSMPGEGKSTVAANLAHTLALSGSRVLLVDADLRKGHLHRLLGMHRTPGLAELLNQTGTPEQVMQKDPQLNLTFIGCGEINSGNPGDLFLTSGLDQILAHWRQDFDYVLIDSSPLFAADDASCLAPKVDGTLFVVRNQRSGARAAREALDLLAQRQARVLGVVFNGANTTSRSYYYYKYSEYHHPKTET